LNPGALQGGSGEQYFVGRFDGKRFTNDNPPSQIMWTDYGKDCYCALTFNNLPRGERTVMIGWMNNWQYAAKLPTSPWRGQMTFPRSLALRRTPEGIRLVQAPIDQLANLEQKSSGTVGRTGTIGVVNRWLAASGIAKNHPFQLKSDIPLGTAREVGWKLLASNGNYTLVGYDRKERKLFFDRTHSGSTDFSTNFPDRTEAPLTLTHGILRLNILVDRSSVEVFAADGRVASTNLIFPPSGTTGAEVYAKDGEPGEITTSASGIQSIWISRK
jgi:fructan beta-fructosidase